MVTEEERRIWNALDEAAEEAGGYVVMPKRPLIIEYDYRAMTEYCRKKGVSKMELTEEELKLFEFDPPLVYE
jgi:hypothetical protein